MRNQMQNIRNLVYNEGLMMSNVPNYKITVHLSVRFILLPNESVKTLQKMISKS